MSRRGSADRWFGWPEGEVRYWRDKHGHEVDFILVRRGRPPIAVECKWSTASENLANLRAFRRRYPEGENWIVVSDLERALPRRAGSLAWTSMGLAEFSKRLVSV